MYSVVESSARRRSGRRILIIHSFFSTEVIFFFYEYKFVCNCDEVTTRALPSQFTTECIDGDLKTKPYGIASAELNIEK